MNRARKSGSSGKRRLNLALQGGGAHGAFTWGALDALLADGRFDIEGISGTSAGAMNAVCVADGIQQGGAELSRERLAAFWEAVGLSSRFSPLRRTPIDAWMGKWSVDGSPILAMMDMLSRIASPYDYNPFDINPLRDIVEDNVRFDNVRACTSVRLFVAATNVWNGKVRIFRNEEITADAVMASSCLPYLFKAVEINGVPYWDGGYMGNPVLFPFFYETAAEDILLVQINPVERRQTPKTARQIADRINEITFNASLLREFRAIEFVRRLIDEGVLDESRYKRIRMHRIAAPEELVELSASTKFVGERSFLHHLRELGEAAARSWLDNESGKVGLEAGIDLSSEIAYGMQEDDFRQLDAEAAEEILRGEEEPAKRRANVRRSGQPSG